MEYTTKQLAELCGTTTQTIRNTIKRLNCGEEVKQINGRTVIPYEIAVKILAQYGKTLELQPIEEEKPQEITPDNSFMLKELEILKKQLNIKDEQIQRLTSTIGELTENNKVLLKINDELSAANKELSAANNKLSTSNLLTTVEDKKELFSVEDKPQEQPQPIKKHWWQRIFE